MILEVDIRKKLGDFKLDVSFESENAITAVLGASGCGKSMTLKCIAGIETPDEGRIVLNGRTLFDSEKKINLSPQKRRVGYMFQDYALFPHMTVEQNVGIGCKKKLGREFYERFHIEGLLFLYPSQLSGGQKQRVAMARMLAAEPELIILDEPFSALDSHLKFSMEQDLRRQLKSLDKPTLFVSHNRDEVFRLCDYVGAMADGKMKGISETKEFFHSPKTRTAAILSGCKNIAAAVRKGEDSLYVPEWNVTLQLKEPVPFERGYVGIRAHYFNAVYDKTMEKQDKNCFPVDDYAVYEDMFEWNLNFRQADAYGWSLWKTSKEMWDFSSDNIPAYFTIDPDNILLLSE